MNLCLAIESATDLGSVAVGTEAGCLCEITLGVRRHARGMVPAAKECLRIAGVEFGDLRELVIGDGPGSFTGLRVGAATMKGLLTELGGLSVSVAPSLMAAAWAGWQGGAVGAGALVAALYDALRGEVFAAVYSFTDESVTVHVAPRITTIDELMAACERAPGLAVGDGAVAQQAAVAEWTGRPALGPPAGSPRASGLLRLRFLAGGTRFLEDPMVFEPEYGRLAEAQVRWEERHGRSLPNPPGDS
jgi:tRNA threonylcarbamoyladenosine biosynthesis protein TsaB